MKHLGWIVVVVVGCGGSSKPQPAPPANGASVETLEQEVSAFMTRVTDVIEVAAGDCERLAVGLEPLAPSAQKLGASLEASGKTVDEVALDAATEARVQAVMSREPDFVDRCERDHPRANAAIDATLMAVVRKL